MSDVVSTDACAGADAITWRIEPAGFFSRHFNLYGGELTVKLEMTLLREGCDFTLADHRFSIRRKSIWKDGFQLIADGQVVCNVARPALSRRYELTTGRQTWTLRPAGWISRVYRLSDGELQLGAIVPAGVFTRRRAATFAAEVPPPVQVMAIFLVLVVARRKQSSD